MRTKLNKLKIGVIATLLIIPIILWQSFLILSTKMGDITYLIILFPFAMTWANFSDEITFFLLGLGILQFPAYAVIIAFAKSRKMLFIMLATILALHTFAIGLFYFLKQ